MNCKTSLLELARLRQILSEATVKDNGEELLRADWAALGFQESQKQLQALFDGCIVNTSSPSLQQKPFSTNKRKEK